MLGFKNAMAYLSIFNRLDPNHITHFRRTALYASAIAAVMGVYNPELKIDESFLDGLRLGALVHDIGKSKIPGEILNKPSSLTSEEFDVMKLHTIYGCDLVLSQRDVLEEKELKICYEACRWHHERIDGSGYPDGLKEEEIPLSAQIIAIADAYDALTHDRVYRKAFSHETAMETIISGHCGPFSKLMLQSIRNADSQLKAITESVDLDEDLKVLEERQLL